MGKIKWQSPLRTGTPTYGRYCGKNYTGGRVDGTDTSQKGVDVFDEACRQHDIYYQNHQKQPKWPADLKLMNNLDEFSITAEYDKLTDKQKIYVGAMSQFMASQGALGLYQELPKVLFRRAGIKAVQGSEAAKNAATKVLRLSGEQDHKSIKEYNNSIRKVIKLTGKVDPSYLIRAKRALFPFK